MCNHGFDCNESITTPPSTLSIKSKRTESNNLTFKDNNCDSHLWIVYVNNKMHENSSICPELTLDIQYMTDCKSKAESSNQNTNT